MPKRSSAVRPMDDALFTVKQRKAVPRIHAGRHLRIVAGDRPMFGCLAVYIEDKIVIILRDKRDGTPDKGVWLATTEGHHESLRREFPNMRSIQAFGKAVTGWQVLPVDSPDFERAALRACELILAKDPRIGKVPERRARRARNKVTRLKG